jgi:hypothetical protein
MENGIRKTDQSSDSPRIWGKPDGGYRLRLNPPYLLFEEIGSADAAMVRTWRVALEE